MLWLLSLLFCGLFRGSVAQTDGSVALVYGLQAQRPPIARVNQTWTWTLLNGTFANGANDTLVYSASGLPSWAAFDVQTLTFSGTPVEGDLGSAYVQVEAALASDSGTSASDGFNLLVSDAPLPTILFPVAAQLLNGTGLPGGCVLHYDGSLRIPPYWSFSIGLQWNTFALPDDAFAFYTAYIVGTTSLPDWLQFNPANVVFSGVAPASGFYDIIVFGSAVEGYGDVTQRFTLTISDHDFDLLAPLPALNTSLGAQVDYVVSTANITVDYMPAEMENITAISVDLSALPFLQYSNETATITGQVPSTASSVASTQVPVTFTDSYGQTLTTSFNFTVMGATDALGLLSNNSIPALVLQPGETFQDNLSEYAVSSLANYSIVASPNDTNSWLSFNATSKVLSGTVPNPAPSSGNVTIMLLATDPVSGATQNETFPIVFAALASIPGHRSLSNAAKIAIGIALGLFGLFLLLLALWCCCRRRQRYNEEGDASMEPEHYTLKGDMSPYPMSASPLPDMPITPVTPLPESEKPRIFAGMFKKRPVADRDEPMQVKFDEPRRFGLLSVVAPHPQTNGLGIQTPEDSFTAHNHRRPSTYRAPSRESVADSFVSGEGSTSTGSMLYTPEPTPERPAAAPRRWVPRAAAEVSHEPTQSEEDVSPLVSGPPVPASEEDDTTATVEVPNSRESASHVSALITARRQIVDYGSGQLRDVAQRRDVQDQIMASRHAQTRSRHIEQEEVETALRDLVTPRSSVYAGAYVPQGTPVTSAVLYSPAASTVEHATSPVLPNDPGHLRMVTGAQRNSIFAPDERPSTPDLRRGRPEELETDSNLKHEPQRVVVKTSGVLKFVPVLQPKPLAILGSPSRNAPTRKTYTAYLVHPNDPDETKWPIPKWLTWNEQSLEFWGIPKEADVGELNIQIISRGEPPSPSRRDSFRPGSPLRPDSADERLVARVTIETEYWIICDASGAFEGGGRSRSHRQ